jgi:hypothetical protein
MMTVRVGVASAAQRIRVRHAMVNRDAIVNVSKRKIDTPGAAGPSRPPDGPNNHALTRSFLSPMARIRNVFEIIELYGHDENFEPQCSDEFTPTHAPAGSKQKIDVLAERIQRGMPLWHPEDSTDSANALLASQA